MLAARRTGKSVPTREVRALQNILESITLTCTISHHDADSTALLGIEIQYSNAAKLRAQLREIAPMNDDGRSKIFCPNGTSSAVSPLMENKCGDRQALPSVFGRTDDAMGNSVPGFGGPSPSALRAELDAQAYFRSN
jgi:hypothetical protein